MDDVKTFPRISKVHLDPKDGQATLTVGVVKKKPTAHVQSEASEMGAGQDHHETTGHCPPMRGEYFSQEPIGDRGMSASAPHPQDDGDHYAKLL